MRAPACIAVVVVLLQACAGGSDDALRDPIPDVPPSRQRTVTRGEFDLRWPLTVGTGTLGCTSGAVLFRSGGVTYALNGAARTRRYAAVGSIQQARSSAPTNPLKRLDQDERMRIFAAADACERADRASALRLDSCGQRLLRTYALSEPELRQIQAEGQERRWPPLSPARADLTPLVDAGLRLCAAK